MIDLLGDDDLLDLKGRARRTDPAAVAKEERARRSEAKPSNDALEAWREEHAVEEVPEGEGDHVCRACKRHFRATDFWNMFGLCRACAREDRVEASRKGSEVDDANWLD